VELNTEPNTDRRIETTKRKSRREEKMAKTGKGGKYKKKIQETYPETVKLVKKKQEFKKYAQKQKNQRITSKNRTKNP
jgi:hypothetical protein